MKKIENPNVWQITANKASTILKSATDWECCFAGYAKEINDSEKLAAIRLMRRCFHQWAPLYLYSTINAVKNSKIKRKHKIQYGLRFHGQDVATISVENESVHISATEDQRKKIQEHFRHGKPPALSKEPWGNKKAAEFRKFFNELEKKLKSVRLHEKSCQNRQGGKSEEHFWENRLLIEFSKKRKNDGKALIHIQPVKLAGAYFQMLTPLAACKGIAYSKNGKGGGIDILAHVGVGGATKLCIMELKDENKPTESPNDVMHQSLAYSVFIAHLLKSDSGNDWYKIFGFDRKNGVPKKLKLMAAIVMPKGLEMPDFNQEIILHELDTTIVLRSLYFEKDDNGAFDFFGSLKSAC